MVGHLLLNLDTFHHVFRLVFLFYWQVVRRKHFSDQEGQCLPNQPTTLPNGVTLCWWVCWCLGTIPFSWERFVDGFVCFTQVSHHPFFWNLSIPRGFFVSRRPALEVPRYLFLLSKTLTTSVWHVRSIDLFVKGDRMYQFGRIRKYVQKKGKRFHWKNLTWNQYWQIHGQTTGAASEVHKFHKEKTLVLRCNKFKFFQKAFRLCVGLCDYIILQYFASTYFRVKSNPIQGVHCPIFTCGTLSFFPWLALQIWAVASINKVGGFSAHFWPDHFTLKCPSIV